MLVPLLQADCADLQLTYLTKESEEEREKVSILFRRDYHENATLLTYNFCVSDPK